MSTALLAQQYEYETELSGGASAILIVVWLAVAVFFIAAAWRLYTKAGEPGWAVIVPIYNCYVMLRMVGRPWWWLLLYFVPLVGIVIAIIVIVDLAKSFGKGTGYALGLIFLAPIFFPMLAFGKAQYQGPAAAPATA